jgi:hypothetical protein
MKAPKKITLDWNKLLAFRQHQNHRGPNNSESLNRLKSAMVGGKIGKKSKNAR